MIIKYLLNFENKKNNGNATLLHFIRLQVYHLYDKIKENLMKNATSIIFRFITCTRVYLFEKKIWIVSPHTIVFHYLRCITILPKIIK